MNVLALPVRHKPQTQRPLVMLETTTRSSACGHRNPPEATFCGACGTSLSPQHLSCAICGHPNPARVKFCRSCGTDQSTALPPAFRSTAATRRSAVEQLSPSSPQALEHVAKALAPPKETWDMVRGTLLVGHEAELIQLQTVFETVLRGERRIVCVTGEAGIGKTTLVDAFLAQLRGRADVRITSGQCVEHYGPGEAYLPLLEATTRLCRTPGGERHIEALQRYAPSWLAQLPGLLEPQAFDRLQQRAPDTSRERMLREMAEAAELFAAQHGLVLTLKETDPRSLTPDPQGEAEACFLKAIDISRQQQAKALELHAVMSLSRLWLRQGKRDEVRNLLQEIYAWFTEGFDTKDLREAAALLRALGGNVKAETERHRANVKTYRSPTPDPRSPLFTHPAPHL